MALIDTDYCVLSINLESRPLNGVSLTRACLAIGEYCSIISLHAAVYYRLGNHLEDYFLACLTGSHVVKRELLLVLFTLKDYFFLACDTYA